MTTMSCPSNQSGPISWEQSQALVACNGAASTSQTSFMVCTITQVTSITFTFSESHFVITSFFAVPYAKHPNMPQSAPNATDEEAVPPNQSPNQAPNQICSPQPNGIAPAPNAGDQQLQTQTSTDDEPLPVGWEIR